MAVPSFFLGILVTFLFGVVLKWFAPGSYVSYRQDLGDSWVIWHFRLCP